MQAAAYLTEVNVELTLSASAMGLTPLGPSLLFPMLQVGSGQRVSRCQRLLTLCQIRQGRAGGAPQLLERGVDLERLGEVFGANGSEFVVGDAANGKGTEVSAAADSFHIGQVRATHLSLLSALLTLSASARCLASSGPRLVRLRLQTRRNVSAAADNIAKLGRAGGRALQL